MISQNNKIQLQSIQNEEESRFRCDVSIYERDHRNTTEPLIWKPGQVGSIFNSPRADPAKLFERYVYSHAERLNTGLAKASNLDVSKYQSVMSQYRIPGMKGTLRINSGVPGPEQLLSSNIHGNECMPLKAMIAFAGLFMAYPRLIDRGSVIFTLGNPEAMQMGRRYNPPFYQLEKALGERIGGKLQRFTEMAAKQFFPHISDAERRDLNRMLLKGEKPAASRSLTNSERIKALIDGVYEGALTNQTARHYIDFHTMTMPGEAAALCYSDNWQVAEELCLPNIIYGLGSIPLLKGSTLCYAEKTHRLDSAFTVECGQHHHLSSAIPPFIAIYNALKAHGIATQLPPLEEIIQSAYLSDFMMMSAVTPPKVYQLVKPFLKTSPHMRFAREFKNFEVIRKGEVIAYDDDHKPVYADDDYNALMPTPPENQPVGVEIMFLLRRIQ